VYALQLKPAPKIISFCFLEQVATILLAQPEPFFFAQLRLVMVLDPEC
jgi:hypothetical protein